eukprot:scaffold66381_cov63-Phaeocystis_antarctica.AAC.1
MGQARWRRQWEEQGSGKGGLALANTRYRASRVVGRLRIASNSSRSRCVLPRRVNIMQLHSAFHRGTKGCILAFCWGGSRAPATAVKEGRQPSQAGTAMVGSSRGEAAYTSAEVASPHALDISSKREGADALAEGARPLCERGVVGADRVQVWQVAQPRERHRLIAPVRLRIAQVQRLEPAAHAHLELECQGCEPQLALLLLCGCASLCEPGLCRAIGCRLLASECVQLAFIHPLERKAQRLHA